MSIRILPRLGEPVPNAPAPTAGQGLTLDLSGRIPKGAARYAPYTPTWTSTGTAPAIGNAIVRAQYAQVGALVHCYGQVTFGSTSTFGTGTYSFALPIAASANMAVAGGAGGAGSVWLYDNSANVQGLAVADCFASVSAFQAKYPATYLGTLTAVTPTTPWTWASGDIIGWNLTYEAA